MQDPQLRIPERAALLALMTMVGEASNPDLQASYGLAIHGAVREHLRDLGFIGEHRAQGIPGRPYVFTLTDEGWRWCREELARPAPQRAPRPYRLMYGVLHRLDGHMSRTRLAMADVFTAGGRQTQPATAPPETPAAAVAVEKRIRGAYDDLVSRPGGWVGLRRLREQLSDFRRADVDAALLRLDLQSGVYLEPESNQKALSDADWASAIEIGGEHKHLLSIERS